MGSVGVSLASSVQAGLIKHKRKHWDVDHTHQSMTLEKNVVLKFTQAHPKHIPFLR